MLISHPLWQRLTTALALSFVLSCLSSFALAQQSLTATLEGIITDPNGAVIPSAKVTARNTQTGQTRTTQADESGIYRLPLLQPGVYELSVSAPNFTEAKRSGLTLTVGQKLNLDIALAIGGSNETINISAEAPIIETSRTNISSTVSDQQVATLPIRGRNFLDLVSSERAERRSDHVRCERAPMNIVGISDRQLVALRAIARRVEYDKGWLLRLRSHIRTSQRDSGHEILPHTAA